MQLPGETAGVITANGPQTCRLELGLPQNPVSGPDGVCLWNT